MTSTCLAKKTTFPALRAQAGGFEDWFARAARMPRADFEVVDAVSDECLPDPTGVDPVMVTGSPHSVHDRAPWSVRTGAWLRRVVEAEIPVLGVCYGHQLLADVLGGEVGPNPNGREVGVCEVEVVPDPLFAGLPRRFSVYQTHTDAVNRAPPGATVLAGNAQTPIQAMRYGSAWTVQWHPEFNVHIIRAYLEARADLIDAELGPGTAERLRDEATELHSGPRIFANFLEACR